MRAKLEGNPEEQPCQPEENYVLPNSFTEIYILFPYWHRRFHIGLPKILRRSVLALLKSIGGSVLAATLNLLPPEFHSR